MRKDTNESPFLDRMEDGDDRDELSSRCGPIQIHSDVRRALEIREEMKRLRHDLAEFDEDWDDVDDVFEG